MQRVIIIIVYIIYSIIGTLSIITLVLWKRQTFKAKVCYATL